MPPARLPRPGRDAAAADPYAPPAPTPDRPPACNVDLGRAPYARLERGRRRAARRRDRLCDPARQPGPLRAERRPDEAARLGLLALPRGDRRHERSRLCRCEGGLRAQAGRAGRGRFPDAFAAGRLPAGATGGRHGRGRAARVPGAVAGPGPDLPARQARRGRAARRFSRRLASWRGRPRRVVCDTYPPPHDGVALLIVTVTMNAAIDRTLTVPNFQRGQRHRASAGLTLAGGKGINVARALKVLGVPVVATGLAGGRTGTRIIEELTAEAILNDFVRIEDESRTSTAVVDPTGGSYTEVNEWGPHVSPEELEMLLEKLVYLSQGAAYVVFSGSLPRGIDDGFYAEAVRELNRRGAQTVLDSEGEPLRLGWRAEPLRVSPNEREAEALVGQEFNDDDDFLTGLETIAELGARNVLITRESGCWALLRAERHSSRYRAVAPRVDPVSAVGSGDVLLAGFVAARLDGRSDEEALRAAVAAGAASTLEIGAGRFEPREAGRLIGSVDVAQLEAVGS